MLVTLLPIVTLVKPLQLLKAELSMVVTLSPIATLVKPRQFLKALSPMLVPLGILTVKEVGFVPSAIMLTINAGPVILVIPVHPEKAEDQILITLFGIVTLVKPTQSWKASLPMLVTGFPFILLGINKFPLG